MNIPVKITVGCEVMVMPDPDSFAEYQGVVEAIHGKVFDVTINGKIRIIHITQISVFTFGGIWMPNYEFIDAPHIDLRL